MIPVEDAACPASSRTCASPGPIAGSRFTEAEMAQITAPSSDKLLKHAVEKFAPGWTIAKCGSDMDPGLRAEEHGQKNVLFTHPLDRETACVLSKRVDSRPGRRRRCSSSSDITRKAIGT